MFSRCRTTLCDFIGIWIYFSKVKYSETLNLSHRGVVPVSEFLTRSLR
jgi:hypothetical protein